MAIIIDILVSRRYPSDQIYISDLWLMSYNITLKVMSVLYLIYFDKEERMNYFHLKIKQNKNQVKDYLHPTQYFKPIPQFIATMFIFYTNEGKNEILLNDPFIISFLFLTKIKAQNWKTKNISSKSLHASLWI